MAEFWFDTRTGDLLFGREAAGPRIDEAGPDIVYLPDLLKTEVFPFTSESFKKADVDNWTRQDYVNFGKWAVSLSTPLAVSNEVLKSDYIF